MANELDLDEVIAGVVGDASPRREDAAPAVARRVRSAFLHEILDGFVPSRPVAGTALARGLFVTLVVAQDPRDHTALEFDAERVLEVVEARCQTRSLHAMCTVLGERVWALLPASGERGDLRVLATEIIEDVRSSLGVALCAAIGTTVSGIGEVPRSRRDAEHALVVLIRRRPDARILDIEDVRAHAVLLELADWAADNEELERGKLDALLEYDRRHGTSYRSTLRVYLDARRDVRKTAERLEIHPNTLRHRVRRLVQISGLDLDDPEERLATELQLRMRRHEDVDNALASTARP